jgi:hypothetical protein
MLVISILHRSSLAKSYITDLVLELQSRYDMKEKNKVQSIIRILIGSRFYFDLSVQERYDLIKHILCKFPFSI